MAPSDKPEKAQPKTAQSQSTDPTTASHLQWTVKESNKLTDPSTDELLRKAANKEYDFNGVLINIANDLLSDIPTELFEPEPFVDEREGSKASKK